MPATLVETLNAQKAVVAERIDAVYLGGSSPLADHIIEFDSVVAVATAGFVGRDGAFATLERFCRQHANGFIEIVADAGLGKTALAAEIARRRKAIAFFASASRGLTHPNQFLTHAAAALISRYGLDYDHLPARAGEDASFLATVLAEAAARSATPVFLVVDALDEAETPPPGANPLLLPADLPPSVFCVVTRRPGPALMTLPTTPVESHVLRRDDAEQRADIRAHIERRVLEDTEIAQVLSGADPPVNAATFVDRLAGASDGNFMYVSYVLADLVAGGSGRIALDTLPNGLSGYYEQFWAGIQAAKTDGWTDWDLLYRPTIERLAIAAEAVTADWLARHIGRSAGEIRERALQKWIRLLSREQRGGSETWRIIHRSFADFLAEKVDLRAAHSAVADRYILDRRSKWADWDEYGLRHAASHLASAVTMSAQPDRHTLVEQLVELVTDAGYQSAHLDRLHDPLRLERDLETAVTAVAGDDDARAPLLAIRAALTLQAFRGEQRQPAPIFELARRGEVEAAARRLDLFALDLEGDWYHAVLLAIAWLGAATTPADARRVRDRVAAEHPAGTLDWLLRRLDASLGDGAAPVFELPPAPSHDEAVARVDLLGGSHGSSFLVSELGVELRQRVGPDAAFLADDDGPLLVALAATDPAFGEPLLKRYVAIHSAYGYREYRQGSLWSLLGAVVRHPDDEWVRTWVAALAESALAPNRGDFTESLGLASLLVRALGGDAAADAELEQHRHRVQHEIAALPDISGRRGEGDTWGILKRRAAALAEVIVQRPGGAADASALLSSALGLRYGFAGFSATACLALAEAIEIARHDDGRVEAALTAALRSAHNIQDGTFCARTTARVNAMRTRWWPVPGAPGESVAEIAERLRCDPAGAEFAAVHVVGEQYVARDPTTSTPLPEEIRAARTLEQLARVYRRPLVDMLHANAAAGWSPDEALHDGVAVNIPDPGFTPLLAARLAGRALADVALPPAARANAIGKVVRVAADDTTALHTVLARLLMACQLQDPAALATLADLAELPAEATSPDALLAGRLTTFVP